MDSQRLWHVQAGWLCHPATADRSGTAGATRRPHAAAGMSAPDIGRRPAVLCNEAWPRAAARTRRSSGSAQALPVRGAGGSAQLRPTACPWWTSGRSHPPRMWSDWLCHGCPHRPCTARRCPPAVLRMHAVQPGHRMSAGRGCCTAPPRRGATRRRTDWLCLSSCRTSCCCAGPRHAATAQHLPLPVPCEGTHQAVLDSLRLSAGNGSADALPKLVAGQLRCLTASHRRCCALTQSV